jgi:hypothetical protein
MALSAIMRNRLREISCYQRRIALLLFLFLPLATIDVSSAIGQDLAWVKPAGGVGRDAGTHIAVDRLGNSYVAGFFSGSATFGPGEANETVLSSSGNSDIYVGKYDSTGALLWVRRAGGPNSESANGIALDDYGNIYVTGYFESEIVFSSNNTNQTLVANQGHGTFIARYDNAGLLAWARFIGAHESSGIAIDPSGNIYVTGLFDGTVTFGTGEANQTTLTPRGLWGDTYIAKYDSGGSLIRVKGVAQGAHAFAIAVDQDGNSYVTGHFAGSATFGPGDPNQVTLVIAQDNEVFVAKYDSEGALAWVRRAGFYAIGRGIAVDGSGNVYVTGFFGGLFGNTGIFGAGEPNETLLTGAGYGDVFVAKYDRSGALRWARGAGGTQGDNGADIAVDASGNSYVTGAFYGVAVFGAGTANAATLQGSGNGTVFVAKYSAAGDLVWARSADGSGATSGGGIAVDWTGASYLLGSFGGDARFGAGEPGQRILASSGVADSFLARYGPDGVGKAIDGGKWEISGAMDSDGDRRADILWREALSGNLALWRMDGSVVRSAQTIGSQPVRWRLAGAGDFDGDGKQDLLWRDSNGDVAIGLMDAAAGSRFHILGNIWTGWTISGVGDFDGNGKADILWRSVTGDVAIWLMDGTAVTNSQILGNIWTGWTISGIGDFDGNGKADILWRDVSGYLAVWIMNGTAVSYYQSLGNIWTGWRISGIGDFDGNGTSDVLWRSDSGDVAIWLMNGTVVSNFGTLGNVWTGWVVSGLADFDGNGKADILWRSTSGEVALWMMDGIRVISPSLIGE